MMNFDLVNKTAFCFFSRQVLFFLLLLIPTKTWALDIDKSGIAQILQSTGDIHITEGTVVYSEGNIYVAAKDSMISKQHSRHNDRKEKIALSKTIRKKRIKADQYIKKNSVNIQFKSLPLSNNYFLFKTSFQCETVVSVTQHLKFSEVLQQVATSIFYTYRSGIAALNFHRVADNLPRRKLQIRPPPIS